MNREQIFPVVIQLFEKKGTHFTTLDLAKELKTSKRSLYTYFSGKNEIIKATIDYIFHQILASDQLILENDSLTIKERIELFMNNIPDVNNISALIRHLNDLKENYPDLFAQVESYLDIIWDNFITLIDEGIRLNEIELIDTKILRIILVETMKKILDTSYVLDDEYDFQATLKTVSCILLNGIFKRY